MLYLCGALDGLFKILKSHQTLFALDDLFKHLEVSSNIITITHPVNFNLENYVSSLENQKEQLFIIY